MRENTILCHFHKNKRGAPAAEAVEEKVADEGEHKMIAKRKRKRKKKKAFTGVRKERLVQVLLGRRVF